MFKNIVGQERAKKAILDWYKYETQPLLIYGTSGYGKTMFAESLGAKTVDTTQMRGDRLNSMLKPIKEAEDGDILFFDEIHSLQPKILEGLYKIIDKGTFYDTDLCMDLELPKARFVFATNILSPLPEAFINRCKFVELQNYTDEELAKIVQRANPDLNAKAIPSIIRSAKGVPRTALSLAKSMKSAAKSEKLAAIGEAEVNSLLDSRFAINGATGLSDKEFLIMQRVAERGKLSSTAVANVLGCSLHDAKQLYIEPLRAAQWLAVSNQGVIMGLKGHENYRLFMKKKDGEA
ncbi:MAG: AAA family ATPase [Cytophagales bacterium]|nr:AAA family ATPase [Cytophagales bacterium]